MQMAIIPTEIFTPNNCINIKHQTNSWIDLKIVRIVLRNILKIFGILNNLKKISEDKIPNINPKVMLNIQLANAIKIVSFNLKIKFINISMFILGLAIDDKNSIKISNPPK